MTLQIKNQSSSPSPQSQLTPRARVIISILLAATRESNLAVHIWQAYIRNVFMLVGV